MKEIEFRARPVGCKDKPFAYGYLFKCWDDAFICWGMTNDVPNLIKVDPKTIGQYTGYADRNYKKIYETDIVKVFFQMGANDEIEESIVLIKDIRNIPNIGGSNRECEVIGNIHDNPELLKKEE